MIPGKAIRILLGLNLAMLVVVAALLWTGGNGPSPALKPFAASAAATPKAVAGDGGDSGWTGRTEFHPAGSTTEPSPSATPEPVAADSNMDPAVYAKGHPGEPLIPVGFVDPKPEDHFTPAEMTALQSLREQFQAAINAPPVPPADSPEYYARWKEAKEQFDSQFAAQFGIDAMMKYQEIASHIRQY